MADRGGKRQLRTGQAASNSVYGSGVALAQQANAAPLAGSGGGDASASAPAPAPAPEQPFTPPGSIGDLLAPTTSPEEPLTAGIPLGAGPGPTQSVDQDAEALKKWLPILKSMANNPYCPPSVLSAIRWVGSQVPPEA